MAFNSASGRLPGDESSSPLSELTSSPSRVDASSPPDKDDPSLHAHMDQPAIGVDETANAQSTVQNNKAAVPADAAQDAAGEDAQDEARRKNESMHALVHALSSSTEATQAFQSLCAATSRPGTILILSFTRDVWKLLVAHGLTAVKQHLLQIVPSERRQHESEWMTQYEQDPNPHDLHGPSGASASQSADIVDEDDSEVDEKLLQFKKYRAPKRGDQLKRHEIPATAYGSICKTQAGLYSNWDAPYKCPICDEFFDNPERVRSHFRGKSGYPREGCWFRNRRTHPNTNWNDHPSCQIDEEELNIIRVPGGFQFGDKESFDKVKLRQDRGFASKNAINKAKGKDETGDEDDDQTDEDDDQTDDESDHEIEQTMDMSDGQTGETAGKTTVEASQPDDSSFTQIQAGQTATTGSQTGGLSLMSPQPHSPFGSHGHGTALSRHQPIAAGTSTIGHPRTQQQAGGFSHLPSSQSRQHHQGPLNTMQPSLGFQEHAQSSRLRPREQLQFQSRPSSTNSMFGPPYQYMGAYTATQNMSPFPQLTQQTRPVGNSFAPIYPGRGYSQGIPSQRQAKNPMPSFAQHQSQPQGFPTQQQVEIPMASFAQQQSQPQGFPMHQQANPMQPLQLPATNDVDSPLLSTGYGGNFSLDDLQSEHNLQHFPQQTSFDTTGQDLAQGPALPSFGGGTTIHQRALQSRDGDKRNVSDDVMNYLTHEF